VFERIRSQKAQLAALRLVFFSSLFSSSPIDSSSVFISSAFFFVGEDVFHQGRLVGSLSSEIANNLGVGFDGNALGN
jgi:hypothetical protein